VKGENGEEDEQLRVLERLASFHDSTVKNRRREGQRDGRREERRRKTNRTIAS
jgi:hypothetical protein